MPFFQIIPPSPQEIFSFHKNLHYFNGGIGSANVPQQVVFSGCTTYGSIQTIDIL